MPKPELTDQEMTQIAFSDTPYIVSYNDVYFMRWSKGAGASMEFVYKHNPRQCSTRAKGLPLTRRGRFHKMNFKEVNKLIGFELLIR